MAYAADRSGARLSVHTAQALVTWPVSTPILYASCRYTKQPDEIKHSGVAYLSLSMAFTYQRATSLEAQQRKALAVAVPASGNFKA